MMGMGFHGMWRAGRSETPITITREMLLRIVGYFGPYWRQGLLVLVTVGLMSVLGLLPPLMIRALVDVAIPERDASLLTLLALGMVAAPTVAGLLGVVQTYLNTFI